MPLATGDIGYQDRLEYEEFPKGSGNWMTVYQVRSVTLPKKTASKVDFTHLESPDRTKESKPGMGDWSSVSFEAIYDPANATHGQLLADTATYPSRNFRVLLRNSVTGATEETWTFPGHVEEVGLSQIEADSARLLQGSIGVEGAIAIT